MSYTVNRGTTLNNSDYQSVSERGNSRSNNENRDDSGNSKFDEASQDAIDRSANRSADRTVNQARQLSQIAQSTGGEEFNRDTMRDREGRAFKGEQAELDRKKSSDEFTQTANRDLLKMQVQGNKEKGDAALESTKAYRDQGFRDITAANDATYQKQLANVNIAGQKQLADISQQTAFGEQKASIERAKEAAKAQVTSALYGSSRQYAGY